MNIKKRLKFRRVLEDVRGLFSSSHFYIWTHILSLLFIAATFLLPYFRIIPFIEENNFIPLHYNIYFGIDQFGPWYYVFMPALLGLIFYLGNLIFQSRFYKREPFLSKFFSMTSVCVELIFFSAIVFITLLNT